MYKFLQKKKNVLFAMKNFQNQLAITKLMHNFKVLFFMDRVNVIKRLIILYSYYCHKKKFYALNRIYQYYMLIIFV